MSGQDESRVINGSDDFVPMPRPGRVTEEELRRLDAVPFEFADIRALAQRILKRAQEQGMAKIEAARKQVAAMEKDAYDKAYKAAEPKAREEGFAKGEKEGMAAAEKKIAAAIESEKESLRQNARPVTGVLEQLAAIMNENRQQLTAQAEADLLLLALDIARRLVGRELSLDPEAIRPLAAECIGLVTDRTGITARVNPEDFRVMNEIMPELRATFPDLGPVKIEPDPSVERGGLLASTRESEVDMRLATRLAAFEEAILGFSGDAATAPWNAMPPEALEAAKQARRESEYSLPPADGGGDDPEPPDFAAADDETTTPNPDSPPEALSPPESPSQSEAPSQPEAPSPPEAPSQPEAPSPPPEENPQ